MKINQLFDKFSSKLSAILGRAWVFGVASLLVAGWLVGGLFFGFGDLYQLIINTTTTIITFLMVFIIQNTQNRDSVASHLKLDELLKAVEKANEQYIDSERLPEDQLKKLRSKMGGSRE